MLPKKNRVTAKEVEKIFKEGKSINSPSFRFKFLITGSENRKISAIVPKTVAKTAVGRNHLRRLAYLALASHLAHFPPGITAVLVFKKSVDEISALQNEFKGLLDKIN